MEGSKRIENSFLLLMLRKLMSLPPPLQPKQVDEMENYVAPYI